jgi:hypothetical protein
VAVAIAKDQRERIRRCVAAGVASGVPLEISAIANAALALWHNAPAREGLARRATDLKLADGLVVALDGIGASLRRP